MAESKQSLLRSVIASHFQTLLDQHSFKEATYQYDSKNFGNEIFDFRSPTFVLRFTTDRGCLGIDLRPTTDNRWIDVSIFLEFLGHPLDLSNVKNHQGIIAAEYVAPVYARALENHVDAILDLLRPQNIERTQLEFEAFLKERGPRMFPALFGQSA